MKTCYLVQGAAERNQWENSLIIIGLFAKETCFAEKNLCYTPSDKKLVIQLPGSEGCGHWREIVALGIIELSSIPQDIFEPEETPDTWFTNLLEFNTFAVS